jgi:hypothetical protein
MIPAQKAYFGGTSPLDSYAMNICWPFGDGPAPMVAGVFPDRLLLPQVQTVEVSCWHTRAWKLTGLNATRCRVDVLGSLDLTCWGKLFSMEWYADNHDQQHDPIVNGNLYANMNYLQPVVYGDADPTNNLAVMLFCAKQFAPWP